MSTDHLTITVLSENTSNCSLKGEHGLSLHIDFNGTRILLDAGQSPLFYDNALELGISLEDIDCAILSHAHYDHANGFSKFFSVNSHAPLYARTGFNLSYYSYHSDGLKDISPSEELIENKTRIFEVRDNVFELPIKNAYLIAHSTPDLIAIGSNNKLYKKVSDELQPDDFSHEQSLVLRTSKGLVIFNSCSHGGVCNIVNEVKGVMNEAVYAYIGGFHLSKCTDEEVVKYARLIKPLGIRRIVTGHCTGDRAFALLCDELGEAIEKMYPGMEIFL